MKPASSRRPQAIRIGAYRRRDDGHLVHALVAALVLVLYMWWRSKKHKTVAEVAVEKIEQHAEKKQAAAKTDTVVK